MNIKFSIVLHFALGIVLLGCAGKADYEMHILNHLKGMEKAWRDNNRNGVASFYSEHGYLLSGNRIEAHGEEQIRGYWQNFRYTPVDWKLTSYILSENVDDIYRSDQWIEEEMDMPDWNDFEIVLPDHCIYQLGRSDLIYERNGDPDTSTVNFLLVWEKTNGDFKIFIDTYD